MFIFIFCRSGVVLWRGRRRSFAVEFNAGEHDATLLHLCHHAPRHHDSPRSNRCARGWSDRRSTQRTDIGIAAGVIAFVKIGIRHYIGIDNDEWIGGRRHGSNKRACVDEPSVTADIAR
jgi:hypothetical protein